MNDLRKLIISPLKWMNIHYEIPYILNLKNKKQELFFLGIKHTNNYQDKQIIIIKKYLEEFIKRNKDFTIIVENKIDKKIILKSEKDTIKKYGESGLLTYQAKKYKIPIFYPEPSIKDIFLCVKKEFKFKKMDIALWSFLNAINFNFQREPIRQKGVEFLIEVICYIDKEIGINKLKSSDKLKSNRTNLIKKIEKEYLSYFINRIKEIYKWELPKSLDQISKSRKELEKKVELTQDLSSSKTIINTIGVAVNWGRDILIAEKILNLLKSKKKLFGVYGANHVVAQKPVFEEFFKK